MSFGPVDRPISRDTGSGVDARRQRRDFLELSIGYGLILLTVWTPQPWQRLFYLAAFGWVVLVSVVSFDGWSAMGFRVSGSLRSLWVVGFALLFAAGAAALAFRFQTLQLPGGPEMLVKRYWGYAIWTLFQQFLLLDFVLLRLLRLLPSRMEAVFAAAGLFAFAHLPNPVLTATTLLWALAACSLFLHYRNIYTLALAHAILGICISVTVPASVHHNMRVGLGYLFYGQPNHHHRSQKDHIVSTSAWVIDDAPIRRS